MATLTIRKLPDETHRALKSLAIKHGRSAEAEVRHIIEQAVLAELKIGLGSALRALGEKFGGIELDIKRDNAPIEYAIFE